MEIDDPNLGLSHFQEECRKALERLFSQKRLAASSEIVQGNRESYIIMRLDQPEKLEVFIYEDEAGFFLEQDWTPYESMGFNSPSELLEKLVSEISQILARSVGR